MRTCIIAAISENRVIGRDGGLPWHLPADLRHFKRLTLGRVVIMGRRTFESIGGSLPGRTVIVVTRRGLARPGRARVATGLDEALEIARGLAGDNNVFIAGGSAVYEAALARADRMHLTVVHARVEGDTFFPDFDPDGWELVEDVRFESDERHEHAFSLRCYDRRKAQRVADAPSDERTAC